MRKWILAILSVAALGVFAADKEDIVCEKDFSSLEGFVNVKNAGPARLEGRPVLKIDSEGGVQLWITVPAGESVRFSAEMKGNNVVRLENQHYFGAKCELFYKIDEKSFFSGLGCRVGTFDWIAVSKTLDTPTGKDLPVMISFGLHRASGTMYVRNFKVEIVR